MQGLGDGEDVECARARSAAYSKIHREDGDKHEQAAHQRVQKEFYRGIFLARPAPDSDQEVHGHEHDFPEHVEQEEIKGHKYAEHAGFKQEKESEIGPGPLRNAPGGDQADRGQKGREHDEGNTQSVHSHVVSDSHGGNPLPEEFKLETCPAGMEIHQHANRQCERRERCNQGRDFGNRSLISSRQKQNDDGPGQRGEHQVRQQVIHCERASRSARTRRSSEEKNEQHSQQNKEQVVLNISGLHLAGQAAGSADGQAQQVHKPVHDPLVPPAVN